MKITEGERVKPDQTARDSAYWLGRIMRALIVGFGSGNRLDQTGKVRCPAGPPQRGWGTAGLTLDAVSLLCRRLNKLVSSMRSMRSMLTIPVSLTYVRMHYTLVVL